MQSENLSLASRCVKVGGRSPWRSFQQISGRLPHHHHHHTHARARTDTTKAAKDPLRSSFPRYLWWRLPISLPYAAFFFPWLGILHKRLTVPHPCLLFPLSNSFAGRHSIRQLRTGRQLVLIRIHLPLSPHISTHTGTQKYLFRLMKIHHASANILGAPLQVIAPPRAFCPLFRGHRCTCCPSGYAAFALFWWISDLPFVNDDVAIAAACRIFSLCLRTIGPA